MECCSIRTSFFLFVVVNTPTLQSVESKFSSVFFRVIDLLFV